MLAENDPLPTQEDPIPTVAALLRAAIHWERRTFYPAASGSGDEMTGRCLIALALTLALAGLARADVIRLKAGGELRGKIVKSSATRNSDKVTLETLTGAVVSVPRDDVGMTINRPLTVEDYETRVRHLPETLEAHWHLAEWCRSKGLTSQRETHLQRVIEFDPDHEQAHLALGHVWKEGAWVDWDDYMAARGYVKHKGRFVTQQELELMEKSAAELKREQEWYTKLKLWTNWLTGRDTDRAHQALTLFHAIQDDDAAPAVARFLGENTDRQLRLLGVEILSRSGGAKSAKALAKLVLKDADNEVRYTALQGIPEQHFEAVQPLFIKELRNEANPVVCRSGQALGRVGDERAIPSLIEALVTSHKYEVRVPGGSGNNYSFAADGSGAGQSGSLPPDIEVGLRTGQFPNGVVVLNPPGSQLPGRTVLVRQDQQNSEVLAALQKLSGENYGYDERLWRLWWATKKAAS